MNSFLINLKEKGRKFFPVLCLAHRNPSEGGSSKLCATSCPDLSSTERGCTHAKIIFFRDYGFGL